MEEIFNHWRNEINIGLFVFNMLLLFVLIMNLLKIRKIKRNYLDKLSSVNLQAKELQDRTVDLSSKEMDYKKRKEDMILLMNQMEDRLKREQERKSALVANNFKRN